MPINNSTSLHLFLSVPSLQINKDIKISENFALVPMFRCSGCKKCIRVFYFLSLIFSQSRDLDWFKEFMFKLCSISSSSRKMVSLDQHLAHFYVALRQFKPLSRECLQKMERIVQISLLGAHSQETFFPASVNKVG